MAEPQHREARPQTRPARGPRPAKAPGACIPPSAGDEHAFLVGGGEMGARIRAMDWTQTPLGGFDAWPQSLRTCVRIMLTCRQPMFVWWGKKLINLYNDAYIPALGRKHPAALGNPARTVWREIWSQVGPRAQTALTSNDGTYDESFLLIMERHGYAEETYFTFSYSPVPDDEGGSGGIICACTEETGRIVGERQLALLNELARSTVDARNWQEVCARAAEALTTNAKDLPFAAIYLGEDGERRFVRAGVAGLPEGHEAAPPTIDAGDESTWPLREALRKGEPVMLADLSGRFASLPPGDWPEPPRQAALVPIAAAGQTGRPGVLVAGLNPYRLPDPAYKDFLNRVAGQIAAGIAHAEAYAEEKKRAEALAELDRAKTTFLSNVSHEFRTPLTLILGPAEDLLAESGGPAEAAGEQVRIIHRNGLRMLKLVNTLLDFSRIEAGRMTLACEPTDLAAFTAELASTFRAACQQARLTLEVDCPPLSAPVHVDRTMWEKIVLNLLSNAFKYTLRGGITVRLREVHGAARLEVRDTGIGISKADQARLFERFYRVEGARGRSMEGSGIGLALTSELVKLHGGSIAVESAPDVGSTFIVTVPLGTARLPAEPSATVAAAPSGHPISNSEIFVQEALRWLPESTPPEERLHAELPSESRQHQPTGAGAGAAGRPRVLVADDNADLREYLRHILQERYDVALAADGQEALARARRDPPDVVVSDVMMPGCDGFELLRALRGDASLARIPVILLSARAGEEATVQGLDAGADDYLVKPFSARELLARVGAQVTMSRLRGDALAREQALRAEAELLNDVARVLTTELDVNRLVQKITASGKTITGASFGAFYHDLVGADEEVHELIALAGITREEFVRFGFAPDGPLPGTGRRVNGAMRVDDLWAEASAGGSDRPAPTRPPVRSLLAVPVVSREGRNLGRLFFGHPEPEVFTERAERLALGLAAQAAIALDNAQLYAGTKREIERRMQVEHALRESEERYRELVQGLPAAIYTADASGRLQLYNEAAIGLWGRVPGPVDDYASGIHRFLTTEGVPLTREQSPMGRVLWTGRPITGEELIFETPDGKRRYVLVHSQPVHVTRGNVDGAVTMLVDISERKHTEAQLIELKDKLAAELAGMQRLHAISTRLVQTGDLRALLPEVAEAALDLTAADFGHIQLVDDTTGELRIVAQIGFDAPFLHHFGRVRLPAGAMADPPVRVTVANIDEAAELVGTADGEVLRRAGVAAYQSTPLVSRSGQLVGMMSTFYRGPHEHSERDLRLLDLLARQAADLIAKAQVKDDLRESEERIRSLLALLPTAVYACDAQGRITFFNRRAAELWGETPRLCDDHTRFCAFYRMYLSGEQYVPPNQTPMAIAIRDGIAFRDVEVLVERRDGSRFLASVNIDPIRDADGRPAGAINVFEDITQRKEAEQALRRSEERLRLATETGKVGVWDWDISTDRHSWTGSLYALHGVQTEDIGQTGLAALEALVHPDDREAVRNALRRAIEEDVPYEIEFRAVRPDGEVVWLYTNARVLRDEGRPVRMLGATVDITRQKTTEAALRRSEEQFRLLADCIPQLAWVARPDGRVIWFNQRWYEYTGRLPEEMIGDGWQSVVDPVELQGMLPKYKAAMASGEPWEDTFPLRRHDGAMRWHLSRAVPLRDEQGRILHWFGTNTDITEQREVAAALREAKEAAEAASQAKDRFLAILSHELRTPLTPVMMAAGAMEKNQDLPESVRQDAAMIKDSVRLETKLIDDLLDLSRITSGKLLLQPESVDLNDAVLHVIGVCGASFNERCIRLHCSFDENVGTVFIDPARLQQVLWNVLRNAAKFTGEGGDVYVSTSVLPSGYYAVTVRDTGIGIAPEALSRIFDAFEQADNQITRTYGGLGLGLAISKAIIELQQGTIRAESEGLGKGTSFIVELEPERPGRLAPEAEPSGEAAQAGRRLRLLVVDDHDGTARMLERILQSLGHSVRSAGSIAETMSLLERETFDMLISDIGLPDGSGYELVQRVHERVRLPAIAVSGYGMVEDMERSKATGFDEHIVKPLDIGQLDKAIRRLSQREEGGSAS